MKVKFWGRQPCVLWGKKGIRLGLGNKTQMEIEQGSFTTLPHQY